MKIDNPSFYIRKAQASDLSALLDVARKSFLQAFTANNKLKNVLAYLDFAFTESQFSKEMAVEASSLYIAILNENIIGYTKFNVTPAQTDIHDPNSLEIARLYVLEDFLGLGLGKLFLDQAITFGRKHQKKYIWLGVWEHNPRAIRFYQKHGFVKFDTHPFPFGDEIQTDWLMRLDI